MFYCPIFGDQIQMHCDQIYGLFSICPVAVLLWQIIDTFWYIFIAVNGQILNK